ncbi:MAG: cytochrome b/b6 domain-containing protein [Myxococcota bacterium]
MAGFSKYRPPLLRSWHVLNGLVVLGLLGTVVLRKTVLSWRANGPLIEAKVAELGGAVTSDQATAVAKLLRDQMWEWHHALGVALLVLVVVRVAVVALDREQSPLRTLSRAVAELRAAPGGERPAAVHALLVKATHTAFYALLLVMSATGATLLFREELGVGEGVVEWVKETHELLMWGIAAFVPLHVVGVVVAELRGERGLVSEMIHGGRR